MNHKVEPTEVPEDSKNVFSVKNIKPLDGLGCLILGIFLVVLIVIPIVLDSTIEKKEKPDLNLKLFKTPQAISPAYGAIGDVEVKYPDYNIKGYIEANTLTKNESDVICRHLGYTDGSVAYSVNVFRQDSEWKPAMVVKELKCTGTEDNLKNCTYWIDHDMDEILEVHNVTGVICHTKNTANRRTYFLNVSQCTYKGVAGYINTDGYLGPICSKTWGQNEADVFCREHGFESSEEFYLLGFTSDLKHTNNSLSNIKCTGTEKSLLDCKSLKVDFCDPNDRVVIKCLSK